MVREVSTYMSPKWDVATTLHAGWADPAKKFSAHGLAWQAALEKAKVKLDLLTDIDMLSMVQKGIRGGQCHSIYRYPKANNKRIKDYEITKEL